MWKVIKFKTKTQYDRWIEKNGSRCQWNQVFINNGYAVEFRPLRTI